jgi:hypothetical protein
MTTNTNYDWANVSDQYLDEIIELNLAVANRFVGRHQIQKLDRAIDNVKVAQRERENRRQRSV